MRLRIFAAVAPAFALAGLLGVVAGCKSAETPPPKPAVAAPAKPPKPPVPTDAAHSKEAQTDGPFACDARGAAQCFARAEAISDREPQRAETQLATCLKCAEAPTAAYRLLATLRADRGAKREACDALLAGLRAHPESDALYIALARAELELGRPKEALSAYATAHRLRPEDEQLEREYREVLARFGNDEDRVEADVQALMQEAIGRAEIDDLAGARDTLATALKRAAKVPRLAALVRHRLALVQMRRGEPKLALDELEKVLAAETAPTALRGDALVTQSEALLALGRAEDAARAAEGAITIEPKHTLAHANLAIARAVAGNKDGAIEALRRAFDLGLARRLTLAEFLAIGPAIDRMKEHPDFAKLVQTAWPKSAYPKGDYPQPLRPKLDE